jgi:hypothetical protein
MRLTRQQKRDLLIKHGRYVEPTLSEHDPTDPGRVWYWVMKISKRGSVSHARRPFWLESQAWQALARRHLMH